MKNLVDCMSINVENMDIGASWVDLAVCAWTSMPHGMKCLEFL